MKSDAHAYEVENREVIAETPTLRVVVLTLAPGQAVPLHYHSEITDTFLCLEGPMVVATQGGRTKTELAAGESHAVPPRTAHHVSGRDGGRCKFAIVQGIGTYDYVPVEGK
jgi:quercetin dioxygenase-like cupin family protein